MQDNKPVCKRCGRCCHFFADEKIRKCLFLVILKSGTTVCRVFKNRLGREIYVTKKGLSIRCTDRTSTLYDYVDCPFNENKPYGNKKILF